MNWQEKEKNFETAIGYNLTINDLLTTISEKNIAVMQFGKLEGQIKIFQIYEDGIIYKKYHSTDWNRYQITKQGYDPIVISVLGISDEDLIKYLNEKKISHK